MNFTKLASTKCKKRLKVSGGNMFDTEALVVDFLPQRVLLFLGRVSDEPRSAYRRPAARFRRRPRRRRRQQNPAEVEVVGSGRDPGGHHRAHQPIGGTERASDEHGLKVTSLNANAVSATHFIFSTTERALVLFPRHRIVSGAGCIAGRRYLELGFPFDSMFSY